MYICVMGEEICVGMWECERRGVTRIVSGFVWFGIFFVATGVSGNESFMNFE